MSHRVDEVLRYHERTKHHPGRYARALGYMDWDTQPDPFQRFEGAPLTRLDRVEGLASVGLEALGHAPATPLDRRFVSRLLMDSLGLSAWNRLLGLKGRGLQSLYNFTVGRAVLDDRLQTLDAYHHLD